MSATIPEPTNQTNHQIEALIEEQKCEFVNGQLVELKMSGLSSKVAARLIYLLTAAVIKDELGDVFGADCGFQCFASDERRIRRPDVAFVEAGRLTEEEQESGFIRIPPDLAVEVISPNDLYHEIEEKVEEYIQAGVKLVWIIDPVLRTGRVVRKDGTERLGENDKLDGGDVIPGFGCTIADTIPRSNASK